MNFNENLRCFLDLMSIVGQLQSNAVEQLESGRKSALRALKSRELKALLVVYRITVTEKRPLSLKDLAGYLNSPVPSISLLVTALVEKHLLRREIDTVNRRYVQISLSEQGRQILADAVPAFSQRINQLLTAVSEDDRKNFLRIAETLYQSCYPPESVVEG